MAAAGAWLVAWASCGRRGGVVGSLGLVWPPEGPGRSPGPRVAAVWGVAGPLGFVYPPWGRGRSPGLRVAAVWALPVPWA